ncbi:MAG: glycosyltransferase family 39 protein [Anaerolineaceae bacterium]|nr:glycosyltransferase family 39 protein [Anaerolineaceae bacterium]
MGTTEIRITQPSTWLNQRTRLGIPRSILLLGLILGLSAVLLFYNLQAVGEGNLYYTAAVKSMLISWKNFFFVAAEPGGSVSVDKPPLGFWLQTLSALIFGVNGFAVLLPEILAGIISVAVLYHLIARKFGSGAGLAAALALAVTPAAVAVDRNNTIDALLVLTLLMAAWAFIKAVETNRLRYLMLGAIAVGLGFNIKMLEAFIPLPAFLAFYFLCSTQGWGLKITNLLLTSLVLCAVSFSWITIVDLTPASQRPYVGSSSHNSEWELAFGYNGLNRLAGRFSGGGAGFGPQNRTGEVPSANGQSNPPLFQNLINGGQSLLDRGRGFSGNQDAGQPGMLRFFQAPLSKQVSWLLPFALIGLLSLTIRSILKFHLPLSEEAWPLVLWGGWLLTGLVFFSMAGFMHSYYVTTIAPPIAALAAVSLAKLHQFGKEHAISAGFWLIIAAPATLAFQTYMLLQFRQNIRWMIIPAALLGIGIVAWVVSIFSSRSKFNQAALLLTATAMLLAPLTWSWLTTLNSGSSPVAYSGAPVRSGSSRTAFDPANNGRQQPALLNYLEQHTKNTEYLLAVPSASMGDSYVLASGRPVLFMGGFIGTDPVTNAIQLAELVHSGKLRYVLDNGTLARSKPDVVAWLQNYCKVDSSANVTSSRPNLSQNQARGNRPAFRSGGFFGRSGETLYQCVL